MAGIIDYLSGSNTFLEERKERLENYVNRCSPENQQKQSKEKTKAARVHIFAPRFDFSDHRWFSLGGNTVVHNHYYNQSTPLLKVYVNLCKCINLF